MSEHQLESMPIIMPFAIKSTPFGSMIRRMQMTCYYGWGFPIYRVTYSDEDCWQRYLAELRRQLQEDLNREDAIDLLLPHLRYTIIQDSDIQDVSKSQIRSKFSSWVEHRNDARDGKGATNPQTKELHPRFQYCLYVDDKCLDGFKAYEAWRDAGGQGLPVYAPCVIIDGQCGDQGEGQDGYPNIEGCTLKYTGWMYTSLDCIPSIYNRLSHQKLSDGYHEYARPPFIYPGHGQGLTIDGYERNQ